MIHVLSKPVFVESVLDIVLVLSETPASTVANSANTAAS